MSVNLAIDLKKVLKFSEGLLIAKLEQSIGHLVTSLIDTYKLKIKPLNNKQQGLSHIFMINNLSY